MVEALGAAVTSAGPASESTNTFLLVQKILVVVEDDVHICQ